MSKNGHIFIGSITAITGFIIFKDAFLAIGILLGMNAPDKLEISYRDPKGWKGYSRIIPHRTLTHWVPMWVAALFAVPFISNLISSDYAEMVLLKIGYSDDLQQAIYFLITGYLIGGLSHLSVDFFSKMGVPLLTPFAKSRKGIPLYHTGRDEWKIQIPYCLICVTYVGLVSDIIKLDISSYLSLA